LKTNKILTLVISLLLSTAAFSQSAWDWSNGSDGNKFESANCLAIDSVNQFVYLAGAIEYAPAIYTNITPATMNVGNGGGKLDGFVAKYDFNGTIIWSFNIGSINNDEITGITLDPTGKIYVTGYLEGAASFDGAVAGSPGASVAVLGGEDIFVASYSPAGALIDYKVMGGVGRDVGIDICASSTQVYVTGSYENAANFDGIPTMVPYITENIFIYSMDLNDNTLWLFDAGSDGDDANSLKKYYEENFGITCDEDNVYLIGMFGGATYNIYNSDGSPEAPLINADINTDIVILSVNNFGFYNWGQQIDNVGNIGGMGIANDCAGLYITGLLSNLASFPSGYTMSGIDNGFIAGLDKTTGIDNWVVQIDGTASDIGMAINTDGYGGVYVVGTYNSVTLNFGLDTFLIGTDPSDIFITKYSNAGVYEWAKNCTGTSKDFGVDIGIYKNEDVYVCGKSDYDLDLNPFSLISANKDNLFVGRLPITPTGSPLGDDASFDYPETEYCPSYTDPVATNVVTPGGTFTEGGGNIVFLDPNTGLIDLSLSTPGGPYTITYTTVGVCPSSSTFDISIRPDLPPTITCPADITISNDVGICGAVVSYITPVGADDCTIEPVVTQTDGTGLSSGSTFPVGTTIQTYTVTDTSGLTATCSFNIIVNDTENPVINCVADQTRNNTPGVCTYTVIGNEFDYSGAIDNCGINAASITNNYNGTNTIAGEVMTAGTYDIRWYVTDIYGNTDSCEFEVEITVVDVNARVVDCGFNYTGETTIGGVNNGDNFSCSGVSTPGEDNYYLVTVPAGNHTIVVTMDNVIDGNNTEAHIFWVGSACPVGASCISGTTFDIATQEFPNGSNQMVYQAPGPGTYYLVVDAESIGINLYDIAFDCIQSGVEFDISGGCTGDIDNDGVIPLVNGLATLEVTQCETVTICDTLLIQNLFGYEWLDSVHYDLGSCYENITNITPNGNNTGVYQPGDWNATYSIIDNSITWDFAHDGPGPPADWGDGWEDEYSCAAGEMHEYEFCFDADISSTCTTNSDLDITIVISDDALSGTSISTISGIAVTLIDDCTLNDPAPLFVTCPSDINSNNDAGTCGAIINWVNPTASDNCPITPIQTVGPVNGAVFPVGTSTVTYEATDISGGTATCSFDITVSDNEAPTITCVGPQSRNTDFGVCTYTVVGTEFDNLTEGDNCAFTVTNNINGTAILAGEVLIIGVTNVVWTITDANGLFSTCNLNITVSDNESPNITCSANQTIFANVICQAFVPNLVGLTTATDNCNASGSMTITQSPLAGSVIGIGTTTVTLSVSDASGNSATCTTDIIVVDNTNPIITFCPPNQTLFADASCQTAVPNLVVLTTATDNCSVGGAISITQSPVAGSTIGIGTTTVTITVADAAGNSTTCTADIIVEDTTAPIITICATDQTIFANASCQATVPDLTGSITVTDNCTASGSIVITQSPLAGSVIGIGATTVTITAEDGAINQTTCTADITVADNTDPIIIACALDQTLSGDINCQALVPDLTGGITATDNCTANASLGITQNPLAGSTIGIGTTTVTITVADANGNQTNCTADITVDDNTDPTISCIINQNESTDLGDCSYTTVGTEFDPSATNDNCGIASVTNSIDGASSLAGYAFPTGLTNVIWTITDNASLTNTCSFTVNVIDNENPSITCATNQTFNTDPGVCTYTLTGSTSLDPVTDDNCGVSSLENGFNSTNSLNGETFNIGTTIINWTVTDVNGLTSQCSHTITVEDNEDPLISCPTDQTIFADANCQATVPNLIPTTIASDNCTANASLVFIQSPVAGSVIGIGTNTVTITVTDLAGNPATCTTDIIVVDNTPPTISCVPPQNEFTDLGDCTYTTIGTEFDPISPDDNCGVDSIYNNINGGTSLAGVAFSLPTTNVIWTINDVNGNTNTCSFDVNVFDTEYPTITCDTNQIFDTDLSFCTYTNSNIGSLDPITGDNCGILSITNSFNGSDTLDGAIFNTGTTIINWTITDINGNPSTCSHTVTVNDSEFPLVTCPSDQIFSADPGTCSYTITNNALNAIATDNCGISSNTNNISTTSTLVGWSFSVGTTNVEWTANDINGNQSLCNMNITVEDNEDPIISTCASNQTLFADVNCEAIVPDLTTGISATDNCTPISSLSITQNPIAGSTIGLGTAIITITVTDTSGNFTNCTADIIVEDNTDPVITVCALDQTLSADASCHAMVPDLTLGISANDNCTPNASLVITQSPLAGITIGLGITTVTITVEDIAGNSDTCTADITVEDNENPIIDCLLDQIVSADLDSCSYTVIGNEFQPTLTTDNCEIDSIYNSFNIDSTLVGENISIGTTFITWYIVDFSGNIDSCSFNVIVEDTQAPIISCLPDQFFNTDPGVCSYTVIGSMLAPDTLTDNCTLDSTSNDFTNTGTLDGAILPLGTTTITWTVSDVAGNIDSCSFDVTVSDNENPEMICILSQTVESDLGVCTYTVLGNEFDPISPDDNCGVDSIYNNINLDNTLNGVVLSSGSTDITWYVIDFYGNIDSCEFTITVRDTVPPEITCVSDQLFNTDSGACSYTITSAVLDPFPVTDNCGIDSLYNNINGDTTLNGYSFNTGTTNVIWYAIDYNGNIDSCSYDITVIDNELPTFSCISNLVVETDIGLCTYTVNANEFDPILSNDNCGIDNITNSLNSLSTLGGYEFNIGVTNITWTITDINGNFDICSFVILVSDNEWPTIDAVSDIITCDSIVTYTLPIYSDNCSASLVQTDGTGLSSGSIFPIGITTLKYKVEDVANNSDSTSFDITVLALPNPSWGISNSKICETDASINLNNLINGDSGGTWAGAGVSASTFNPISAGIGNHNITYTVDNGVCFRDSSINIEVLSQPIALAGIDSAVCGLECQLNATYFSGNSNWINPVSFIFNPDSSKNNTIITAPDYGVYTLTWDINNDSICFDSDDVEITFYKPPENTDAGNDQVLDYIFETNLEANTPAEGYGEWTIVSGNANIHDIYNPETFISELSYGTTVLKWTIENGACSDYDDVSISIGDLKIPNGFSPNDDGFNDFFEIPGIDSYQNKVSVFNRWGKLIFEMEQYNNTWDGKNDNGKPLPDDTYFYVIELNGKTYNGYIMINR